MGASKGYTALCICLLLGLVSGSSAKNFTVKDFETIQVALNLEYFEAEYFLWASYGYGLDKLAPYLVGGGPKPIGVQKAALSPYYVDFFKQMGLQEVGHLRYLS